MSNNKQSMKLYTEEQVLRMLEVCRDTDLYEHILTFEDILKTETPIEPPSDEELHKQAEYEDTYSKKALLQEAQNGCGTEHLDATMSNNKQSSVVDWIEHQVNQQGITHFFSLREILQQAKEIHEDEIKKERLEAYNNGYANGQLDLIKQ